MWLIYLLLGLFALIAVILCSHLTVSISFFEKKIGVILSYLFLRIRLMPAKKKAVNYKRFTKKKQAKLLAKEKRKEEKKAAKKKAKKKPADAEKKAKGPDPEEEKKTGLDIPFLLSLLRETVEYIVTHFTKHVKVKRFVLKITVGSTDAAKTAVTYGAAAQGVAYITEILNRHANTRRVKKSEIDVKADFLAEKSTFETDIVFKIRVLHFVRVALHVLIHFLKNQLKKSS